MEQVGRAYRGPQGTPTPVLLQAADGINLPAALVHRLLSKVPLLFDLVDTSFAFLGLVIVLWIWLFFWIDFLRKRTDFSPRMAWSSVAFCLTAGVSCLYLTDSTRALDTFPQLLREAGLRPALEASNALSWYCALGWGLFLVGSAIAGGMQQYRTQTVREWKSAGKHQPRKTRKTRKAGQGQKILSK